MDLKPPMTCNEFVKAMKTEFSNCEFKAISSEGQIIKSKGWIDKTYRLEVNPLIPRKGKTK